MFADAVRTFMRISLRVWLHRVAFIHRQSARSHGYIVRLTYSAPRISDGHSIISFTKSTAKQMILFLRWCPTRDLEKELVSLFFPVRMGLFR